MSDTVDVFQHHSVIHVRDYNDHVKIACICAVWELDNGQIKDGCVPPNMPTNTDNCPYDRL